MKYQYRLLSLHIILWLTLFIPDLSADIVSRHPRLVLTPDRIIELKGSLHSERQQLWELTLRGASEFSERTIPEMADAHNRYRELGHTMPALGLAYLMTGDTRYLDAAETWLLALLAVPEWTGSQNLGRASWAIACALLYDWLDEDLNEEIRTSIKERLPLEANNIIEEASTWRALSNHLLIETAALGIIGLALYGEVEYSEGFLNQADEWARYIIEHAPTDGSWGEGVQYWQYGLSHFLIYLEAAKTSGYKDYYSDYDWLRVTGFFPIHFSLPGRPKEVLNFGDCTSDGYKPPFILFQLASIFNNGYYQDYGIQLLRSEPHKFSWMDLICYNPAIPRQSVRDLPLLKHFPDNDFVALRSSWQPEASIIGFRCGPAPGHRNQADPLLFERRGYGPGHGHPDINSFCLFAYGEWLAIDPGYTMLKKTSNHNTILVNGQGQAGAGDKWLDYMAFAARDPAPAILRVESNQVYDYILGDAGNIYVDEAKLKTFRRHLLFLKPDIVVIADDLEGNRRSRFEWLMHARKSIVQTEKNQYEIVNGNVRLWIRPLLPATYHARIKERELDASDVDGKIITLSLETKNMRATRYLAVLCALNGEDVEIPTVTFDGASLSIQHQDNHWRIRVLKPSQLSKPTDAVFQVQLPQPPPEPDYSFTRK